MATPPTYVGSSATTWNATTTPRSATSALTTLTGDVLVALAADANNDVANQDFTFGGGGTWAEDTINQGGSGGNTSSGSPAQTASQTVSSGSSYTGTIAASTAATAFGCAFTQWRGSDGPGAANQANNGTGSGAPSMTLTTQADNSAIVALFVDWNANDGASRTYPTLNGQAPSEVAYFRNTTDYAVYVLYWPDAGTAGSKTIGITTPSTMRWTGVAKEVKGSSGPPPTPLPISYVGAGAWDAPATVTTVTPAYPAGLQQDDICYATIVVKPNTATVTTPANWTLVGTSGSIAGGTAGAGTGPIQIHVFKRVVPAGGLSGSQAFTVGGSPSSVVGQIVAFRYDATGVTSPSWDSETTTQYSRTTGSTTYGGTGAANINLGPSDALLYISAASDDQPTTHYSTGPTFSATGATFTGPTAIGSEGLNSAGNDISAHNAYALLTSGSGTSSAAPVSTHTASSAETGGSMFVRVGASGTASSLTPVAASRSTTWDTDKAVASSRATTWDTDAVVSQSRATTWAVRTPVSASRATTWNYLLAAASSRSTTWKTAATATSSRATSWETRAQTAAARATSWAVLVPVVASRATSWVVRAAVAASRATTWNVASTIISVSASRATSWVTRAIVEGSRSTTWETRAAVAASRPSSWSVLTSVAASRATTWRALATAAASRATSWEVRAAVAAARATTWSVLSARAASRATTWRTLALITSSRATTWNVAGNLLFVSASRSTTWRTLAQVAAARSTSWAVLVPVSQSRSTFWTVRQLVAASRGTSWEVRRLVTTSRGTTWAVLVPVTSSRSTTWDVAAPEFAPGPIVVVLGGRRVGAGLGHDNLIDQGRLRGRGLVVVLGQRQTSAGVRRQTDG